MITASVKKRENIAEYLLYMWQIEDLIRANGLDIDKIQASIIDKYKGISDRQRKDIREWYESLIDMMLKEDVAVSGHLQINKNILIVLDDLHRKLLSNPKFAAYSSQFYHTLPIIVELRAKAGENKVGEIETCFNALYGILMLRLQGKEISKETLDAASQISKFLALLSHFYKKDFNDELFHDE